MTDPQKKAPIQAVIEQAKKQLERMIDIHPQGMLLIGDDGTVVRVNSAALKLSGHAAYPEVLGRPLGAVFSTKDRPGIGEKIDRFLRNRTDSSGPGSTLDLEGQNGRLIRFSRVCAGGDHDFCIVLVDDITDRQAADQSREKRSKIAAAEAVVGALMHNINQPLTVITIRCQLLLLSLNKGSLNPDELKKGLEEISELTMQVANTLSRAQSFRDFVTTPYTEHSAIVDLPQSIGDK